MYPEYEPPSALAALQREIDALKREETSTLSEIKRYAKRGDTDMAKTLAKTVVRNREQQKRLLHTKLQMASTSHTVKVGGPALLPGRPSLTQLSWIAT